MSNTSPTLGVGSLFQAKDGDTARVSIQRCILCVVLLLVAIKPVAAYDTEPLLRVDAPRELQVGSRLSIPVSVRVTPGDTTPVLVSATASGHAINVVKGRLLRADAIDPSANPLRFELPVVAATAGVALLNVSVLTYRCGFRCEAIRTDTTQQILVREP